MTIQYVRDQGGTGISVGTTSYTDRPNLPRTNLSLRNVGTASGSITLTSFNGSVAEPITVAAGAPFAIREVSILEYTLKGNGSEWIIYGAYPDFIDPEYIAGAVSVSQPSFSLASQSGSFSGDLGLQIAGHYNIPISTGDTTLTSYTTSASGVLLYDIGIDDVVTGTAPLTAGLWIAVYDASSTLQGTVAANPTGPNKRNGRYWLPSGYTYEVIFANADSIAHAVSAYVQFISGGSP